MDEVLTRSRLNRAALARQMLLARQEMTATAAVERLLVMQAQEAKPPYVGLWSRVAGFSADLLRQALHGREVVRATHVRGTLHLLSAADYLAFRAPVQPVLTASAASIAKRLGGPLPEQGELLAAARAILEKGPADFGTIREGLRERFPEVNERALGYAVRMQLPLVMVPTGDPWAFPANADFTLAELWLGEPIAPDESPAPMVLRYLASYGPAGVADMQTWSGLKSLRPVFEELRPRLRVFRDENGRELFDLPDAPRPEAEVEAPARFLPEFDSLVLAYADRGRIVSEEHRPRLVTKNLRVPASFLWDGFVRGTWKAAIRKTSATLVLTPFEPLPGAALAELEEEGRGLLGFLAPGVAKTDVRVDPAG
ncbi:winged helix DNA-binding domain-containing protein [Actinomadura sp. SCN-SB]|uniref:winged helix DNA-binding domain-containing protein n=1 Tax=Actinomadura sp. SCN-SB TaxID=3373092 RepID=UPI003751025A